MEPAAVTARRLKTQQIAGRQHADPAALVAWMGAVQAQDPAGVRWAVGLRLAGRSITEAAVTRALAEGTIVRTHLMRWTWQLVVPADLRWMLPLIAPRMFARVAPRFGRLGLDDATFRRSRAAIARALRDGQHLTRDELRAALEQAGISAEGQRLAHLMGRAELEGLICSGASRGKSETYALLEARAPASAASWTREEGLAELVRRYFQSRGPATVADFVWWSGLSVADARAGLNAIAGQLDHAVTGKRELWWMRDGAAPADPAAEAHLLPPFDEYLIAYRDRSDFLAAEHVARLNGGGGMLAPAVILGGRAVGTWRRTLARSQVTIAVELFGRATSVERDAIARSAERYGRFLGLEPALTWTPAGRVRQ